MGLLVDPLPGLAWPGTPTPVRVPPDICTRSHFSSKTKFTHREQSIRDPGGQTLPHSRPPVPLASEGGPRKHRLRPRVPRPRRCPPKWLAPVAPGRCQKWQRLPDCGVGIPWYNPLGVV